MNIILSLIIVSVILSGCAASSSNVSSKPSSKPYTTKMAQQRHMSYLKGEAAEKQGRYSEAIKYYKKAASQNHFMAKTNLGAIYYNKLKDYKNAFYWTKQVVDQAPDVHASYNLAQMYRLGLGVKKNYKKALQNYKLAEKMDNIKATSAIGLMYEKGMGVKANRQIARDYYIESATKGDSFAINNLGVFAYDDREFKQARQWFEKAADKGNKLAIQNLALLNSRGQ